MIDPKTLSTAVIIISDLLTLSIVSGLVFVVLIQPRRTLTNILFTLFCASLGMWAIIHLLSAVTELGGGVSSDLLLKLLVTAIGFTAATFYVFTLHFTHADGRLSRYSALALPLVLAGGLFAAWDGLVFAHDAQNNLSLTTVGYGVLVLILFYSAVALWCILNSRDRQAHLLRIPAILLLIAFASNGVGNLITTPVDTILATVVAVWVGWIVMHHQMFNPLTELNRELSVTNRDLRQVISDLASEKSKTEVLNQELQTANRYKTEFLANMSHELRTPLNSIVGYSELLGEGLYGELTEKQLDRLEKIHRNGKALLELINDILDLTKIEAGRFELESRALRLTTIVGSLLDELKPVGEAKGLEIIVALPDDLQPVIGDEGRVRQILVNLVANAIKFTHQGQVVIEAQNVLVRGGVSPTFKLPLIGWLRDAEWVIISVRDTGIGIAPEDQARIFDAFWQVDRSPTREFEGTGMGLAITRKLVELHDGLIWVKSALGQGSTFFVALPAGRRDVETDAPPREEPAGDLAKPGSSI